MTFAAVIEDKVLTALRSVALAAALAVPGEHGVNSVAGGGGGGLGDVGVAAVTAALVLVAQGHVTLGVTLNGDEAVIVIIIIDDALIVILLVILGLYCLQIEVTELLCGLTGVVVFVFVIDRYFHC